MKKEDCINKNSNISIALMLVIVTGVITFTAFVFTIKSDVRLAVYEIGEIKELIQAYHGKTALK